MSETLLNPEDLDGAGQEAVKRLILTLADSKRLMGIRYSDWLLGAPSIEAGIAASSMAQDEWGHARLLYALLKGFDVDPVHVEHDRGPGEYACISALDEQMPDWAALIAAVVVVDGAISAMLHSFAEGTYEPARARVPKMVAEEEFHASLGAAWYKRLAASSGDATGLLAAATEGMLPAASAWVGVDDGPARLLVGLGIIAPAAARLDAFYGVVRPLAALAGVDVDAERAAPEWDASRGRSVGQPDDESIERVRGDRNRALFVE